MPFSWIVLVALCLVLLGAKAGLQGRAAPTSGRTSSRRRVRLGLRAIPAGLALACLVALAAGVPLGALVYWIAVGSSTTLPSASITTAAVSTVGLGLAAAAVTTLAAVPVALVGGSPPDEARSPARSVSQTSRAPCPG